MGIFYENYVRLCASRGESPTAVSKNIGLSNAAPSGWKSGKKPSQVTLEKLAAYFGVAREDLTGEEQKEKPSTPEGVDLSSLSPEDAELVRRILGASEAKKNAIRELL